MHQKNEPILDLSKLDFDNSGCLFYPCAGDDIVDPLRLFKPYISSFWFVDRYYFSQSKNDSMTIHSLIENHRLSEVFNERYSLKVKTKGTLTRLAGTDLTPFIQTEIYSNNNTSFEINRRKGYGVSALREDIPTISVFFYRGDSEGDGGSGNPWLNSRLFVKVLARLRNRGLIVTDGSQTCGSKQYAGFAQFHNQNLGISEVKEFIASKPSFVDGWGNRFDCVGYIGMRYGPTFVWQFHISEQFASIEDSITYHLRREYQLEHHERKRSVNILAKRLKRDLKNLHKIKVAS
jgi:hypothetical protein